MARPEHDAVTSFTLQPAAQWMHDYRTDAAHADARREVVLTLERPDGSGSVVTLNLLPDASAARDRTRRYLERTLKFLLWQRGASRVRLAGCDAEAHWLATTYAPTGARAFDAAFLGPRLWDRPLDIAAAAREDLPHPAEAPQPLGGHTDGCRIGFDLGGSDRKCAAVIDGRVVHSEEVAWNPYFEPDPAYHRAGIEASLRSAASHLPRVDAIGGSAAGIYVNNEVRAASLFRGVPDAVFETQVRSMFLDLQAAWHHVPFEVVNDGDVTALAGAQHLDDGAVLGLAMGTSLAAGYVSPEGGLLPWLNELAFAPIDLGPDAPIDEWSGDRGCGASLLSQQGVGFLAQRAGMSFGPDVPLPGRLIAVQEAMEAGDAAAATIYATLGDVLAHAVAHYASYYTLRHVLLLGRVMSGAGGDALLARARTTLRDAWPELSERIQLHVPDETSRRHGQAVVAAGLPRRETTS